MNNRQAGAFRETIRREERTREQWERQYARQQGAEGGQGGASFQAGSSGSYGSPSAGRNAGGQVSADGSQICYPVDNQGYEMGEQELDPGIYDRAIRISSPRLADNGADDIQPEIQRRVIRQVEVPFTRRVKVPVKTRKIVPTVVQKKVRTKKLVEVPSFKTVEEQYIEVEEVPAVRNKEIWVKKIVPEKYMKKVPVSKTRQVKVPTTVIKEVDDYEIVNVAGSKAIEVDGYRIDDVEDSKLVEVEEYQTYELRPFATGKARVNATREIGPVRGMHHSRQIGNQVFHVQDERVRGIDMDSAPDDTARSAGWGGARRPQSQGGVRSTLPAVQAQQQQQQQRAKTPSFAQGRVAAPPQQQINAGTSRLGASVRSTNGNGVAVVSVNPGEASEQAGLRNGDIISFVNNRPTRNLQEFRQVLNMTVGPIMCQVLRQGVNKLMVNIVR